MRSGGAYYGPQGNRCTRGDRANAEYFKQLRKSKNVTIEQELRDKILKVVQEGASKVAPLTTIQICEFVDSRRLALVQYHLRILVRKHPFIHRYRDILTARPGTQSPPQYQYWYDSTATNPEYGSRVKRSKGRYPKPRRVPPVAAPLPASAPAPAPVKVPTPQPRSTIDADPWKKPTLGITSLTFAAGTVEVTNAELRSTYAWLKDLFG